VQEERNPVEDQGMSERVRDPCKDLGDEIWKKENLLEDQGMSARGKKPC
jgi:hypothetical protein